MSNPMFDALHDYQQLHAQQVMESYFNQGSAHDGSDGGVGKTYIAAAIAHMRGVGPLVLCPKSVAPSWKRVLYNFGVPAEVTTYGNAWRNLGKMRRYGKKGNVFTFHRYYPDIFFDESQYCNGRISKTSKLMLAAKVANSRILTMSATPADNPLQMRALGYAHDLHAGSDFDPAFLYKYGAFKDGLGQWMWNRTEAKKLGFMKKLHDDFYGSRAFRLRKADIPGFPETVIDTKPIDGYTAQVSKLSNELMELYREYEVEAEMTDSVLTKELRYRQMAELCKVANLAEFCQDYHSQGFKFVVFVNYTETRFEIISRLKDKYHLGEIYGSQPDRQTTIDAFQSNNLDGLVVQIDAGGTGVNLHDPVNQVPRVVFLCPTYKADVLHQALQRTHRDGGGFSLQFLVYFDEGIEAKVAKAVNEKLHCMEMLNDGELSGFALAA